MKTLTKEKPERGHDCSKPVTAKCCRHYCQSACKLYSSLFKAEDDKSIFNSYRPYYCQHWKCYNLRLVHYRFSILAVNFGTHLVLKTFLNLSLDVQQPMKQFIQYLKINVRKSCSVFSWDTLSITSHYTSCV